jgi:multicomponent Na+:H+ antiporter subunit G
VIGATMTMLGAAFAADPAVRGDDALAPIEPVAMTPGSLAEGFASMGAGDYAAVVLLLLGVVLCGLSALGILRMPDLYTRMQAAAKAGTLGVACIILATAAHFGSIAVGVKVFMIMVFIFLTTPAAAHLIARAAYFVEVPLWKRTAYDDLHGCYTEDHRLVNLPENSGPRIRVLRPESLESDASNDEDAPSESDSDARAFG